MGERERERERKVGREREGGGREIERGRGRKGGREKQNHLKFSYCSLTIYPSSSSASPHFLLLFCSSLLHFLFLFSFCYTSSCFCSLHPSFSFSTPSSTFAPSLVSFLFSSPSSLTLPPSTSSTTLVFSIYLLFLQRPEMQRGRRKKTMRNTHKHRAREGGGARK